MRSDLIFAFAFVLTFLWGCAALDERDRRLAEHDKICFATLTPNTYYCKK